MDVTRREAIGAGAAAVMGAAVAPEVLATVKPPEWYVLTVHAVTAWCQALEIELWRDQAFGEAVVEPWRVSFRALQKLRAYLVEHKPEPGQTEAAYLLTMKAAIPPEEDYIIAVFYRTAPRIVKLL